MPSHMNYNFEDRKIVNNKDDESFIIPITFYYNGGEESWCKYQSQQNYAKTWVKVM